MYRQRCHSRALLIARDFPVLGFLYGLSLQKGLYDCLSHCVTDIKVVTVAGFHLFPFRTEKLSPPAPMVLLLWESR